MMPAYHDLYRGLGLLFSARVHPSFAVAEVSAVFGTAVVANAPRRTDERFRFHCCDRSHTTQTTSMEEG